MFKHILIPTDGSPVAEKAVKAGLDLAKALGAKVTGYHGIDVIPQQVYGEGYILGRRMIKEVEQIARKGAEKHMAAMALLAAATGVPFTTLIATAESPYEGIIAAAKKQKCDAIFMASHGRRGVAGLVLGSVTQKVLTHTRLPVLVYR